MVDITALYLVSVNKLKLATCKSMLTVQTRTGCENFIITFGTNFHFLKLPFRYFEDNRFLFSMNRCIYHLSIPRKVKMTENDY